MLDLFVLDRDVAAIAARLEALPAKLATAEGREAARALDLFGNLRHTTTKTTFAELSAGNFSAHEAAHRDALRRWVHELLQARIGFDLVIDDVDAVHAVDETVGEAPKHANVEFPTTYRDAVARLLNETDRERTSTALLRVGELAPRVAAVRLERRAHRFEAAHRLDLAHPLALMSSAPIAQWLEVARTFLDRTQPLFIDITRAHAKQNGARWSAADAIHALLARTASEGWPARPVARWFPEIFSALPPHRTRPFTSPAIAPSTFLRDAARWGKRWYVAGAARSLPFALARDPYPIPALRFGFTLATALATPTLQKRALELPDRVVAAQTRSLNTSLFFESRMIALRFLLDAGEVDDGAFEELTARAFGAPLPRTLRATWPTPSVDLGARFSAMIGTPAFVDMLVGRFDEDWFRNPEAGRYFANASSRPAWDDETPTNDLATSAARRFEQVLA